MGTKYGQLLQKHTLIKYKRYKVNFSASYSINLTTLQLENYTIVQTSELCRNILVTL